MFKFDAMLLHKVIRRIKKILTRLLIHNRHYKPKGFYNTIEEYVNAFNGATCIEAFPTYISHLNVSDDFQSRFIGYIDTTIVAQIPAAQVVIIPNGRVHTDNNFSVAIISSNNMLIGGLSFDLESNVPSKNNIFLQNYFHQPKIYSGVVCTLLIGEGGIVNYSHWLIDSISRIALLKKTGWYDKIDWFLVPSYHHDYQKDSLLMLGINESKIISGHKENHIQANTLVATTYVRYSEHIPAWCCQFLRDEFLKSKSPVSSQKKYSPYVYISRNDSTKRRVLNEPELVELLNKYGFKSFELSKLSFQEKINLFANAEIIIATIGAGQANLVFCNENTNVIELMAEDFAQPFFNDLANKVGIHYDYLICKSDGRAQTFKQGEKLNLTVDTKEVEQKLIKMLNPMSAEEISKL